jgi:hypothetical protein
VADPKERNHLEALGVVERIILKLILKKKGRGSVD